MNIVTKHLLKTKIAGWSARLFCHFANILVTNPLFRCNLYPGNIPRSFTFDPPESLLKREGTNRTKPQTIPNFVPA
jgi:hypothetical protein